MLTCAYIYELATKLYLIMKCQICSMLPILCMNVVPLYIYKFLPLTSFDLMKLEVFILPRAIVLSFEDSRKSPAAATASICSQWPVEGVNTTYILRLLVYTHSIYHVQANGKCAGNFTHVLIFWRSEVLYHYTHACIKFVDIFWSIACIDMSWLRKLEHVSLST